MELIISFSFKIDECPLVKSDYIISYDYNKELEFYLEQEFELKITDFDNFPETFFLDNNSLKIDRIWDEKKINAFKVLYGEGNYQFNILEKIQEQIKCRKFVRSNSDFENYYLDEKNKSPDLKFLDDNRVREMIQQTKKVFNDFSLGDNINGKDDD